MKTTKRYLYCGIGIILGLLVSLLPAAAFSERPMRGTYTVPVVGELSQYNSYPVHFKSDTYSENPTSLRFPLPSLLLGEEQWVEFSRTAGSDTEYSGPNGSGSCSQQGREFSCSFHFVNIKSDLNKVGTLLEMSGLAADKILGKQSVAELFAKEPIGVLSYRLRGRDNR